MTPECSVIIPNYNGSHLLHHLFECLERQTAEDIEVILVDNGSADDFERHVPKHAEVIRLDHNYGFAGAINRGIEAAASPFVFLLNNDMSFDEDLLEKLLDFLKAHAEYDFVQPKVCFEADRTRINSLGDAWNVYGIGVQKGFGEKDDGRFEETVEIFSPTGGAALFRKSVFDKIGLFDERFFAYLEDVDLGFRMRLAGLRGVLYPQAVIYHGFGQTSKKMGDFSRHLIHRNAGFVLIKDMPGVLLLKYAIHFSIGQLRTLVVFVKDGKISLLFKINREFWKALPWLLSERKRILRGRKISIRALDKWLEKSCPFGKKPHPQST